VNDPRCYTCRQLCPDLQGKEVIALQLAQSAGITPIADLLQQVLEDEPEQSVLQVDSEARGPQDCWHLSEHVHASFEEDGYCGIGGVLFGETAKFWNYSAKRCLSSLFK
jgi:hypothetical protein